MPENPNRIKFINMPTTALLHPKKYTLERCIYRDHTMGRSKWCCATLDGGWVCTRRIGHKGWHECRSIDDKTLGRWRPGHEKESKPGR